MKLRYSLLFTLTVLLCQEVNSQIIQPGFNKQELLDMLVLSLYQMEEKDWAKHKDLPEMPNNFKLDYRSEINGFDNRWDLFTNGEIGVISIRGSVGSAISWTENFYAGMIPAEGEITINDTVNFKYKLAEREGALVHVGWTLGLASMANDIVSKINDYYKKGYKEFYVIGYSQGATIAQLLRSYLYYLPEGTIPNDIRFKTVAMACPKAGNMEYSFDYTFINRGGWEYRLINASDWVPQVPFTIQRLDDMPKYNPFNDIDEALKGMKSMQRSVVKGIYKKLVRKINGASEALVNVFGNKIRWVIAKSRPAMKGHAFKKSFSYFPAGTTYITKGAAIPEDLNKMRAIFYNHRHLVYIKSIIKDYQD